MIDEITVKLLKLLNATVKSHYPQKFTSLTLYFCHVTLKNMVSDYKKLRKKVIYENSWYRCRI